MPARMKPREALRHYEKLVAAAVELCASPGMLFVASCTYSIGFSVFSGFWGFGRLQDFLVQETHEGFSRFLFLFLFLFFFVVVLIICCCCCCSDYLLLLLF